MIRTRTPLCRASMLLLIGWLCGGPACIARGDSLRPPAEGYRLHCSGCHREDGRGVPGFAPDLRKIGSLLTLDGGREYLGRVPGVAQAPVDDEELARLLTWVLREIANTELPSPYSADEIRRLRKAPLRDPISARKALFPYKP